MRHLRRAIFSEINTRENLWDHLWGRLTGTSNQYAVLAKRQEPRQRIAQTFQLVHLRYFHTPVLPLTLQPFFLFS